MGRAAAAGQDQRPARRVVGGQIAGDVGAGLARQVVVDDRDPGPVPPSQFDHLVTAVGVSDDFEVRLEAEQRHDRSANKMLGVGNDDLGQLGP